MKPHLPNRGPAAMDLAASSSPVAAAIGCMRAVDPQGPPVDASLVREWADTLMTTLYSAPVVRWEYRKRGNFTPGAWGLANANIVYNGSRINLEVRALYEHPPVAKPSREHVFDRRTRNCLHCKIGEFWAGPDCIPPPPPPVDPRKVLPVNAAWLIEPLEKLQSLTRHMTTFDARKWNQETEFLLDKLREFMTEASKQ